MVEIFNELVMPGDVPLVRLPPPGTGSAPTVDWLLGTEVALPGTVLAPPVAVVALPGTEAESFGAVLTCGGEDGAGAD